MNLDLKLKNKEIRDVIQKQTPGSKHQGAYGTGAQNLGIKYKNSYMPVT
jgi:hypothetical protein